MILVDTSIWIDHLRSPNRTLVAFLNDRSILVHRLVIEELACGRIKRRVEFIRHLHSLPAATTATHSELLQMIAAKSLHGVGIGAIDAHLIASAMLDRAKLWTNDKSLARAADRLGVVFD